MNYAPIFFTDQKLQLNFILKIESVSSQTNLVFSCILISVEKFPDSCWKCRSAMNCSEMAYVNNERVTTSELIIYLTSCKSGHVFLSWAFQLRSSFVDFNLQTFWQWKTKSQMIEKHLYFQMKSTEIWCNHRIFKIHTWWQFSLCACCRRLCGKFQFRCTKCIALGLSLLSLITII